MYIPLGERELAREIEQRGMAKGMAKGIEKGMEKGIEKGKEQATFEIAKKLLTDGLSPDVVAKGTGVPIEQIRNLIN